MVRGMVAKRTLFKEQTRAKLKAWRRRFAYRDGLGWPGLGCYP